MTKRFRISNLAGVAGVALSLAAFQSAFAQTPSQPTTAGPQPQTTDAEDTVVVMGYRPLAESEAAALEIQRESDSLVSVLSADAIGNLPDQNIAFAVGRLPGVGIERDQGQARYVNLRGSPNYWTTLTFDGVQIVSPEGRATRFDNIPSALASQVVVNKAITPDMPGGTVAGNVNIITRSALDKDGFSVNAKLAAGYVTLGGGEETDASIVVSDRFMDGKLGLLAQASYYRRNMVTDNVEADPSLATTDSAGINFAREFENKLYRLTRENQSLSLRADYEVDDNNTVFWNNIWTNYTDEELRNNYIFRLDRGTAANGAAYTGATSGNTRFVGTVYGAEININTNSLESEEDIYTSTLGGDHDDFLGWDIDWRANYTVTSDGRDAPALPSWVSPSASGTGFTSRPTVAYDFRDPSNNVVQLFRTGGLTTARTAGTRAFSVQDFPWNFNNISRRVGGGETQAATIQADVEREFDFVLPLTVSAGGLYSDRVKHSTQRTWTANRAALVTAGVTPPEITATGPNAAFNSLFLNKPYLGNYQLGYNFQYHSKTALEALALDLQTRGIAVEQVLSDQRNYWKVGEEIMAGYAMGKLDFDWGNVIAGMRVEQITNSGRALGTINGVSRLIIAESEDTLWYPSAHLNWDINEEMKLRVGLTQSASRPDFDDLRPNVSVNDATQTISGGNPSATLEKQQGIDVYYEWYMQPEGFLSAGVFYKDISDFLFNEVRAFGSDALNSDGIDRSGYAFSGITNGGDGYLQGIEVFYSQNAQNFVDTNGLPDWLGGFGTRVSATFTESELDLPAIVGTGGVVTRAARTVRLPGTSGQVYNLQLSYEKYNFSVRLAYQWRNAWIQGLGAGPGSSGFSGDTYWNDDEEVDLSVRYQVNDNLEWFFDAANLTDQRAQRYRGQEFYAIETEQFGERYIMGVRFNY